MILLKHGHVVDPSQELDKVADILIAEGCSALEGMRVGGAQRVTSAPKARKPHTSERATLLCRISPTMAIFKPSRLPLCSTMVNKSSKLCVGGSGDEGNPAQG